MVTTLSMYAQPDADLEQPCGQAFHPSFPPKSTANPRGVVIRLVETHRENNRTTVEQVVSAACAGGGVGAMWSRKGSRSPYRTIKGKKGRQRQALVTRGPPRSFHCKAKYARQHAAQTGRGRERGGRVAVGGGGRRRAGKTLHLFGNTARNGAKLRTSTIATTTGKLLLPSRGLA